MLSSAPNAWNVVRLADYVSSGECVSLTPNGPEPARPFGEFGLRSRLALAWAVFTGRADAVFWNGSAPKAY
jgi:hypothetical protein